MSRGPHAYPMMRVLDGDAGGAADLQTDVMRFMAILSLCLLAIFALVQSLPPAPTSIAADVPAEAEEPVASELTEPDPVQVAAVPKPVLTRPPAPTPEPRPEPIELARTVSKKVNPTASPAKAEPPPQRTQPVAEQKPGFTLRFESDLALSRLVATGQVGLFAIQNGSAQRMSIAESRISFWAAPVPGTFHEMDQGTVPAAVRDALERTGPGTEGAQWAVTLPARLSTELERLMHGHEGGALVIAKDGSLTREPG